ncbi:MAG: LPS export ABC transporter periplasmic protein LptC [Nitrospiraceae bacterium]|nr:MAG: LPS export ABC transporter periplasmic protein LptC [Nitrospiraceae bacterium]
MMRTRLPFILLFFLVIGTFAIVNFSGKSVNISPSYRTSLMKDLFLIHKEDGNIKWELSADRALIPIEQEKIYLNDLKLKINRQPNIFMTSGSGTYEVENGDITLNTPVKITMEDATFKTNTVTWNKSDDFIFTDDDVQFSGRKFNITGIGLTAQLGKEQVRIMNNVKAVFYR